MNWSCWGLQQQTSTAAGVNPQPSELESQCASAWRRYGITDGEPVEDASASISDHTHTSQSARQDNKHTQPAAVARKLLQLSAFQPLCVKKNPS